MSTSTRARGPGRLIRTRLARALAPWLGAWMATWLEAPLAAPLAAQSGPTSEVCVECHLHLDDPRLSTPARDFPSDIHAEKGFGCLDCHGRQSGGGLDPEMGFLRAPARRDIPAVCGRCHSDAEFMRKYDPGIRVDQVTEYWTSDHGKRLRDHDDPDVATCADCHKVHRIRPPSDPSASTYPLNVPETCGACHADPERMARHGLRTDQLELFRNSVHGRLIFEEGDLSAPVCNDCHGNHGAAPPGVSSIRYVCGQCHTVMGDFFDQNGHKEVFERANLPGCATCHDHHAIRKTSDANLKTRAEEVCATCHGPDDARGREFQAMARLLDSLSVSATASRDLLLEARNAGMEVSQALFELDDVNNALTKARSAIHSFHVGPVEKEVDAGLVLTTKGLERGRAAMEEHRFRRVGLAVSAGFILLLIAGILMKIRDNEARAAEAEAACHAFFDRHLRAEDRPHPTGEDVRLAASAVLLDASRGFAREERAHLAALVRGGFGLHPRVADELADLVDRLRAEPVENGRLSALVKESYTGEQMHAVLGEAWFLVYSDPVLARHEVAFLEALAKLLHVDPDELAAARRGAGARAADPPAGGGDRKPW